MWTIRTERPAYNVAHAMMLHAAVREPQRQRRSSSSSLAFENPPFLWEILQARRQGQRRG
jgi:hypothetical protein